MNDSEAGVTTVPVAAPVPIGRADPIAEPPVAPPSSGQELVQSEPRRGGLKKGQKIPRFQGPNHAGARRQIHEAMVDAKGDIAKAAKALGWNSENLRKFIAGNALLNSDWGHWSTKPDRPLHGAASVTNPESALAKAIVESEASIALTSTWGYTSDLMLNEIRRIQERLVNPQLLYRDEFGKPVEEQMLRQSLAQLLGLYHQHRMVTLRQFHELKKVELAQARLAKAEGAASGRGKPGFGQKAKVINNHTQIAVVAPPEIEGETLESLESIGEP